MIDSEARLDRNKHAPLIQERQHRGGIRLVEDETQRVHHARWAGSCHETAVARGLRRMNQRRIGRGPKSHHITSRTYQPRCVFFEGVGTQQSHHAGLDIRSATKRIEQGTRIRACNDRGNCIDRQIAAREVLLKRCRGYRWQGAWLFVRLAACRRHIDGRTRGDRGRAEGRVEAHVGPRQRSEPLGVGNAVSLHDHIDFSSLHAAQQITHYAADQRDALSGLGRLD